MTLIKKVINVAFSMRRKTIRNSLIKSGNLGYPVEQATQALEDAGIDASRRPQTLELEEFAAIARELSKG